jgi:hypothetical protein
MSRKLQGALVLFWAMKDIERTLKDNKRTKKMSNNVRKMLCNIRKMMGDVAMSNKYQATLSKSRKMKTYIGRSKSKPKNKNLVRLF